jgi:4-amino-4-deoxy-L-arabinose transferase-like glycosyltransferase
MIPRRLEWGALAAVLLAYVALAGSYAVRTPDWQAPDEPAHYNYVRQIADDGGLPVLELGDWNQPYQEALTAANFDPALVECSAPPAGVPCPGLETVQYEDHQPPLYYLLQAPVYALSDGDLTAMRLWSAVIGMGVVLCAWATLRVVLWRWPVMALAGAAFVAFLPQRLSVMGSVSNDALAELIAGLTLLAAVIYLGNRRDGVPPAPVERLHPALLGVLAGLALVTKTTIYFVAGIAVLAVLLRWRRERWIVPQAARHLAWVLVPALIIGGAWWMRNLSVYGGTDFTGLARHDAVTIGQPRTGDYIDTMYGGSTRVYLENYAKTTFHSFWGQFGWMAVPMPANVYRGLLALSVAVVLSALVFAWRAGWPGALSDPQRDAVLVLAAALAFVVAAYLLYNLDFVQFQGRYLYPALIPLAAVVGVGVCGPVYLLREPPRALGWLPLAALFGLAVFAWYALDRYLVPNLPAW